MRADQLILDQEPAPRTTKPDPETAWRLAAVFGLLFTMVGLTDVALALYPAKLSDPAVRFVTFSGIITGTPIMAVGLVLIQLSAIHLQSRPRIILGTVANGFLALLVIGMLVGFLSAKAAAVSAVPADAAAVVDRTVIRVVIFGLLFGVVYGIATAIGLGALRRRGRT